MYQGAVPTPPKHQQVSVPKIEPAPMRGAQLDRAIDGAEKVALQAADLHDLGVQQREELALKDLEAERKLDFDRRSALQWGNEESFFNEDGTRNQNAIDAFNATYQEKNDAISRNYLLGKNRMQGQSRHDEVQQRIQKGLEADIQAWELQNVKAVWQDNYEAEMLRENYGTASAMVDEAVQRGLLRPSQGNLMKLKIGKTRAAKAAASGEVDMTINGVHYSDPTSAQLAAISAKEGGSAVSPAEPAPDTPELHEGVAAPPVAGMGQSLAGESSRSSSIVSSASPSDGDVLVQRVKTPHDLSHAEGMLEKGNIDPYSRKVEHRADGSIATVESFSVNMDGKEVLLPRVIDGKTVSTDAAIEHYKKTGEHLGMFDTPEHASAYAQKFHENQAAIYGGGSEGISGKALTMGEKTPLDSLEAYLLNDDFAGVFARMTPTEISDFSGTMGACDRVVLSTTTGEDGTASFTTPASSPDCVQRMAAQADADGELSIETAKGCVARMTLAEIATNPQLSRKDMVKVFEGSGIYEVFGDGDAELGKVKVESLIQEIIERGSLGSTKLSNNAIGRMIEAHLALPEFGAGQEWKEMEKLNPGLAKNDAIPTTSPFMAMFNTKNPAEDAKWQALYKIYEKYRAEFNPDGVRSGKPLMQTEFNEKAQAFWNWYMGGSHKYRDARKAYTDAARDWYVAEVAGKLRDAVNVGLKGEVEYAGYASDVMLVQETLGKATLPENLGVEELAKQRDRREKEDSARAVAWRSNAAEDAAHLRQWKKTESENSEKAQKAKAREEEKAKREEERKQRAEEEKERKRAQMKLNVERMRERKSAWVYDGKDAAVGEAPHVIIPQSEAQRLENELGYDGTQTVYLMCNGQAIRVAGVHPDAKEQRFFLNTTAVVKIQPKPKKGATRKVKGDMGYSYRFSSSTQN